MQELIKKADILIEALPYIQGFRKKIVVVKYGGSTMETGDPDSVLRDIVFMECVGMRPVVVHGGGNAISTKLKERGIAPSFIGGLRVTDAPTMRVVEEVLLEINRGIVARLEALGAAARGFPDKAQVLHARTHLIEIEKDGRREEADIGFVGDVEAITTAPLRELCRKDIIPVIAPIGVGEGGQLYNINADTVAGEVAAALKAQKLILLTDVRGLLRDPDDENSLMGTLRISDIDTLISQGVIKEGMLPKVRAALISVRAGVKKTHIIYGRLPHSMLLEIFTDKGIGTEIVPA
ncbi:MAG: acetylglutamate kinase [Candidatus Aureabacteria bacterium]|nr:acetylglutamate kinase [Candidatus Auribacterota bacterium]